MLSLCESKKEKGAKKYRSAKGTKKRKKRGKKSLFQSVKNSILKIKNDLHF